MRILIAVDASAPSEHAVEFVRALRWPAGSCAIVATVRREPGAAGSVGADAPVDRFRDSLRARGMSAESRTLEGDPREVLPQLADSAQVHVLVVGSRGRTGLMHLLLGSVSSHAVLHAGCSVLVVKERSSGQALGTHPEPEAKMRILLGIDDSTHSEAALDLVRRMVWPKGTHVTVVSVVPPVMPVYSEIYVSAESLTGLQEELVREHERVVTAARSALRESGLEADSKVLHGDPRVVLVEAAQSERAGLVVVGSHGRSGVAKLFMGSVAHHVVTHAPCSVLVVKVPK